MYHYNSSKSWTFLTILLRCAIYNFPKLWNQRFNHRLLSLQWICGIFMCRWSCGLLALHLCVCMCESLLFTQISINNITISIYCYPFLYSHNCLFLPWSFVWSVATLFICIHQYVYKYEQKFLFWLWPEIYLY